MVLFCCRELEMAKDDFHVIAYKILRYLYECMKHDKPIQLNQFAWKCEMFDIPRNYWLEIIAVLVKEGYMIGFDIIENTKDAPRINVQEPFKITHKGIDFLEENSRMKKAAEFAGEVFIATLSSIIGVII